MTADPLARLIERPGLFNGVQIIENRMLTIGPFEDWSDVRSPGRARRRQRRGHKQRIRFYYKPDPSFKKLPDGSLVGHPETVAQLRLALRAHHSRDG